MNVIKKNGRQEPFQADKLALSAINTAGDLSQTITNKEGQMIAADVLSIVRQIRGNDGLTSVYELRTILGNVLKQFGYKRVAQHYLCGGLEP